MIERKATFQTFEEIMSIIMNTDNLSSEDTNENMNMWFECYKETKYFDVIEWARFWFESVNKDTHDFYLDKRGLMLYELKGMIAQTGIFPIF